MTSSRDFTPLWEAGGDERFTVWTSGEESTPKQSDDASLYTLPSIGPRRGDQPLSSQDASSTDSPRVDAVDATYARGLADGLRRGVEEERERLQTPLAALEGLLQSIEAARAEFQHDQERNLYGVAVALARHLIQREIATDDSIVRNLVREAVDLLPRDELLEVRMHPDDLSALGDNRDELGQTRGSPQIHWISDNALERGSFQMESPHRLVDGRTDVALRQLYEQLAYE